MTATDVEEALQSEGVETDGAVVLKSRGIAYVVGYLTTDLPVNSAAGYELVDDPQLVQS